MDDRKRRPAREAAPGEGRGGSHHRGPHDGQRSACDLNHRGGHEAGGGACADAAMDGGASEFEVSFENLDEGGQSGLSKSQFGFTVCQLLIRVSLSLALPTRRASRAV